MVSRLLAAAVLLLSFPVCAQDWTGVQGVYRFGGIPDFVLAGSFADSQAIYAHVGSLDYVWANADTRLTLGVAFGGLSVKDGYWRAEGTRPDEGVHAEFPLQFIGVTASYSWVFELADRLAFIPVVGLGIGTILGDVYATEVIPGCTQAGKCGHWDEVTRHPVKFSSRMLPLVQFSASLAYRVAERSSMSLEAGIYDFPYVGVGFQHFFLR